MGRQGGAEGGDDGGEVGEGVVLLTGVGGDVEQAVLKDSQKHACEFKEIVKG